LALQEARRRGLRTVALVGGDGGEAGLLADSALVVPSNGTQHIQEVHLVMLHLLADLVDRAWRDREDARRSQPASVETGSATTPVAMTVGATAEASRCSRTDADGVLQLAGNGHAWSGR